MKNLNPTHFDRIAPFPDPDEKHVVHVVVETPRDIRHKYAFDPKLGIFKLKLTIAEGLQWPYDYGFVPATRAADGDPVDALFLCDEPTFTGCLVEARLLGLIRIEKNGVENDRLVTCAKRIDGLAQSTDAYQDVDDIPKESISSLCRFLIQYSAEEGNEMKFKGVEKRKAALEAIKAGMRTFKKGR
jgi:inorganic pyrophosphatase